jgi:Fur family transcriptional regulator, ferric uptake regulator
MTDLQHSPMAQALREAGYKLTQPRLAVLRVLAENDAGLNPEAIYAHGKTIYPSLGLVTVYRTLELLAELGLVRRVHSEHRCHSYASARVDRHYLICEGCHRVVEFPCHGLEALLESVRQQTGYTINAHLLELSGLCPECQMGQGA